MRESGYYPPGAEYDPSAPWNQKETPERSFKVSVSQTLSKSTTVVTSNYYEETVSEKDDIGWHQEIITDTSDVDWKQEYDNGGGYTPLELIQEFKKFLQLELNRMPEVKDEKRYRHLIDECTGWIEDDFEIVKE